MCEWGGRVFRDVSELKRVDQVKVQGQKISSRK
jgi:hypothetical protein